uniref:Uncharacterized protein n=1 Tax=Paraburkholderia sprentiae WSM5005 TaxID=754502 RepID=A0A1I9YM79_9BURK
MLPALDGVRRAGRIALRQVVVGQPSRFKCRAFALAQKAFLLNGVIYAHDVHGGSNRLFQTGF